MICTNGIIATPVKGTNLITKMATLEIAATMIADCKSEHCHAFGLSPLTLINYISPLQPDAEVQCWLEVLKNQLPKLVFKASLPLALPMDIEQLTSTKWKMALMMMASLLTMASAPPPSTVVTSTSTTTSTISTTTSTSGWQLTLVIGTTPIFAAASKADTLMQISPCFPSQAIMLPNYTCFGTMDQVHTIMLAMPHYLANINPNVEFFQWRTMQEMVLINFFGRLNISLTIVIHVHATNASLALY
uniref:Uncharacterized protein n=1 Tax=Romanomermis culicivorax TaxID=13658 RepID=A0A915I196_ROMCU